MNNYDNMVLINEETGIKFQARRIKLHSWELEEIDEEISEDVIELTLSERDTPEGYKSKAEYRLVKHAEYFISLVDGTVINNTCSAGECDIKVIVLTPKPFRAKIFGSYFCVDRFGDVIQSVERGYTKDKELFEAGNYYYTREEAEPIGAEVKKLHKGKGIL